MSYILYNTGRYMLYIICYREVYVISMCIYIYIYTYKCVRRSGVPENTLIQSPLLKGLLAWVWATFPP